MPGYLEFHYISPVSEYNFKANNLHILVFSSSSSDNKIRLYKTTFKKLGNINNTVRGYPVDKSLLPLPSLFHQSINASLFAYDPLTKTMTLLFSGIIHLDKIEEGNINYIELKRQPLRSIRYDSDKDFFDEAFFKYEDAEPKEKAFLYMRKVHFTELPIMKPSVINFDDLPSTKGEIWFYDRYKNTVMREFIPKGTSKGFNLNTTKLGLIRQHEQSFVSNYITGKNTHDDYIRFLDDYPKDDRYSILGSEPSKDNFKISISRKIRSDLRPLRFEPYINNIVTSPVDSKITSFYITKSLKLAIGNKLYESKNLVSKPMQYDGGFGFKCIVSPTDYQRVHMPYSGYLKEFGIFGGYNDKPYLISMRFESSYYMPPDVHERDLLSVVNGHPTYGGVGVGANHRAHPELLLPQPDTYLIFNVIIIFALILWW